MRGAVERHTAPLLVALLRVPRWLLLLLVVGLTLAGFAAPKPFGVAALVVLALLMGWLSYLSAPRRAGSSRGGAAIAVAVILAVAVWRALT